MTYDTETKNIGKVYHYLVAITPKKISLIATILIIALASGCASAPPKGVSEKVADYHLNTTKVSFADSIDLGIFPRLDNEDDADFVKRVVASLEATTNKMIKSSLTGPNPADVLITISTVVVSSGVGRALGGHDSKVEGIVEVIDISSGDVIARKFISAKDKASNMGGNVGGFISLIINTVDGIAGDEVEAVGEAFAEAVKLWLDN